MSELDDLQHLLREAVARRSEDYEPSPDLPERIDARVRRHRRRRQVVTGALASVAAAAAVIAAVALVDADGADHERIDVVDSSTTSTTPPSTTTTTSPPEVTKTTAPYRGVGFNRAGAVGIRAGMTVHEAEQAYGDPMTVPAAGGSTTCVVGHIARLDPFGIVFLVEPGPDGGTVRAIANDVDVAEEGAQVGQSQDELIAALGQPTRTEPAPGWGPSDHWLVFEEDGFAFGALVVDGTVLGLNSGDPGWVAKDPETDCS
jgi:hypothetical protein